MQLLKFTKMHGAGNDYIYINTFHQQITNPSQLAQKLSNRHFGIGSDGLVLIGPSTHADIKMQMFNPDGTEAEMCGNASRCVAKYAFDHSLVSHKEISLETKAGVKHLTILEGNNIKRQIMVDMGEPILEPSRIPVIASETPVIDLPITIDRTKWLATCISMGNPHAVIFTTNIQQLNLCEIGPKFESHPLFPNKTNTEFIEVENPSTIHMRVWERGTGETLACGTGACAATVAAILKGLTQRKVTVRLSGGDLEIEWKQTNNHIYMSGEAITVFHGEINI